VVHWKAKADDMCCSLMITLQFHLPKSYVYMFSNCVQYIVQ